ncbi:MAG: hypothetical protein APF82_10550 [Sphingomonadales bacterium BRH_c42]|nr:MAG: hypothetical protein APF82_10550 [Sphingomonadales bacterium BRH_c42]
MGRAQAINDDELLKQLTATFREVGYEAASLSLLAEAAGLKKASLYHRFPGGKEEMAQAVLRSASEWLDVHILQVLEGDGPPEERVTRALDTLRNFYAGGKQACLLNMLAAGHITRNAFTPMITTMFDQLILGFAKVARDAGQDEAQSRMAARRAVMLLQGSLVMARGTGDPSPFDEALEMIHSSLLGEGA